MHSAISIKLKLTSIHNLMNLPSILSVPSLNQCNFKILLILISFLLFLLHHIFNLLSFHFPLNFLHLNLKHYLLLHSCKVLARVGEVCSQLSLVVVSGKPFNLLLDQKILRQHPGIQRLLRYAFMVSGAVIGDQLCLFWSFHLFR